MTGPLHVLESAGTRLSCACESTLHFVRNRQLLALEQGSVLLDLRLTTLSLDFFGAKKKNFFFFVRGVQPIKQHTSWTFECLGPTNEVCRATCS